MHVAHLESGMHLYGGAQQVLDLIAGLRERGIDNTVICPSGSAIATVLGAADGGCLEVPMSGDGDFGFIWRCRRVLEQLKPDLLHVHSRRGADTYGALAARAARVPAVISRRVDNPERRWFARRKYAQYQAVIAISARIRQLLLDDVGLNREQVYLVPDGVDTARFHPGADPLGVRQALGLPADSFLIAMVAQLIPRKGHGVLLEALATLLAAHPDARVLLFGQGPLAARLTGQIKGLGLSDQVKLMGFRQDLDELLPGMDLVVHPALKEGLGVALLETLASGVAAVASDVGGIPDLIEDGVHGRLVPPGDPDALAKVMDQLIGDDALRRQLAQAGRQRVVSAFSLDQMVAGNLEVYQQALE
jgi:glycosyltransferase involved in cell wall biosynthesis